MANIPSEFRDSILQAIERKVNALNSQRGVQMGVQVLSPANPLGAGTVPANSLQFATGYNSGTGQTTVPFTVNMSVVGGSDVVIGS